MAGRQQAGHDRIGKDVSPPAARHLVIEEVERRKTAAKDNHVGIDQVDDARKGAGEPLDVAIEAGPAFRVARGSSGGDLWCGKVAPGVAAMIGGEPRPRQERLDAARAAAIAGRPRQFLRSRRRHRVVPPFAGNRVCADQQIPADHDAAADPGT